jgi:hypothetical protein
MKTGVLFTCLSMVAVFLVLGGCLQEPGTPYRPVVAGKGTIPETGTPSSRHTARDTGERINLTIHSAQKLRMVSGVAPENGVWVIVDLSLENRGFPGAFPADRQAFTLIEPVTGTIYGPEPKNPMHLVDEWTPAPVAFHSTKRGELLFVTGPSPDSYELVIHDSGGNAVSRAMVETTHSREYRHTVSETTKGLSDSANFTAVVEQLTTPEKTLQYMSDTFTYVPHGSLISYRPEVFFRIRQGDCKDYATFFSYVLAQHGYYAEIVSIRYSDSGHSVTIFRDDDGQLKYQSSDKMNGFRNVLSLDDLLQKEAKRTGAGPVVRYKVLPPGSVDMCTMPSGEC